MTRKDFFRSLIGAPVAAGVILTTARTTVASNLRETGTIVMPEQPEIEHVIGDELDIQGIAQVFAYEATVSLRERLRSTSILPILPGVCLPGDKIHMENGDRILLNHHEYRLEIGDIREFEDVDLCQPHVQPAVSSLAKSIEKAGRVIQMARLPQSLKGTGEVSGVYSDKTMCIRAIIGFSPTTLEQIVTIGALFGKAA